MKFLDRDTAHVEFLRGAGLFVPAQAQEIHNQRPSPEHSVALP